MVDFHDGGSDILGGGSIAGAVVGTGEVVVDGLGDAHDAAGIAVGEEELGDFVAGIHGVVAAVVEEVADVVLLKDFDDALIVGFILGGVLEFIAAGAERGGGGILHKGELTGALFAHVDDVVIEDTADAVEGS